MSGYATWSMNIIWKTWKISMMISGTKWPSSRMATSSSRSCSRRSGTEHKTIQLNYWNADKKLYADTRDKDRYSQHANTLAILTGTIKGNAATDLAKKLLSDNSLAPASIYFKYYLHQALTKAGYGNDYITWLAKWKENMAMGLTTWAEMSDVSGTRSDCHAWGSSPNIEFYRTILGIDSDAPGFEKVRIEPHLGLLKNVNGSMPHPNGMISCSYQNNNGKWHIEIILPAHTTGSFIWDKKLHALKEGKNVL